MSKEERAKLALQKRQQEVEAQRAVQEEARKKHYTFLQEAKYGTGKLRNSCMVSLICYQRVTSLQKTTMKENDVKDERKGKEIGKEIETGIGRKLLMEKS